MNSTGGGCFFSSINDVLTAAETGSRNMNISQIVQACPDVCSLAWGTGNPDLSGIGAYASYIFQVAFAIIFGPIFVIIFGFKDKLKLSTDAQDFWKGAQEAFLDASATFSIPVAVAAVVRLHQSPPFFEIAFLQSLTTMQFLSLFSTAIASGVAMPKNREIRRILAISLYIIVDFCFYMGVVGALRTSKSSWTTIQELANSCKGYGSISPGFVYAQSHNVGLSHITAKEYFSWGGKQGWIITGFIFAGVIALGIAGLILFCLWETLKHRNPYILGILSLGFLAGVFYELAEMVRKRNIMKNITGTQFADNQWGFGQVIAIFLWAPLIVQGVYYLFLSTCTCFKPEGYENINRSCHRCRACYRCVDLDEEQELGTSGGARTSVHERTSTSPPLADENFGGDPPLQEVDEKQGENGQNDHTDSNLPISVDEIQHIPDVEAVPSVNHSDCAPVKRKSLGSDSIQGIDASREETSKKGVPLGEDDGGNSEAINNK